MPEFTLEEEVKNKNIWVKANVEDNEDNSSSFLDSIKNDKLL